MGEGQYLPEIEDKTLYPVYVVHPVICGLKPLLLGYLTHEGKPDPWLYQQWVKPDTELSTLFPRMRGMFWPNTDSALLAFWNDLRTPETERTFFNL